MQPSSYTRFNSWQGPSAPQLSPQPALPPSPSPHAPPALAYRGVATELSPLGEQPQAWFSPFQHASQSLPQPQPRPPVRPPAPSQLLLWRRKSAPPRGVDSSLEMDLEQAEGAALAPAPAPALSPQPAPTPQPVALQQQQQQQQMEAAAAVKPQGTPAGAAVGARVPVPRMLPQRSVERLQEHLAAMGSGWAAGPGGMVLPAALAAQALIRSGDDKELSDLLMSWAADDLALLQMPSSADLGNLAAPDAPLMPGLL